MKNTSAQRTDNAYLDSLKSKLQTVKQDTNRCRVLNLIVQSLFRKEDYTPASRFTNEEINLAETLQDSFWIAEAHKNRAAVLYRLGDLQGSIEDCLLALTLAEKHGYIKIAMMVTNILSIVYTAQSRYDLALKASFRALDLCEGTNAKYQASVVLTNLGNLYYFMKRQEKAIEYSNKALELKREIGDFNDRDLLYYNNTMNYITLNDFENASKNLRLAYNSQPKHENSFFIRAAFAQAIIDYKLHRLDEANSYFLKSYELSKQYENVRFQAENLIYIALYNLEKNRLKEAEEAIREGSRIVSDMGVTEKRLDLIKVYATLCEKRRAFKAACGYLQRYNNGMDSTFNSSLVQNLMVTQAELEQHENKSILESQQKTLSLKQQVIDRQRPITILIIVSLILLFILTILFYQNYRRRQKVNELLEDKVRERNRNLIIAYENLRHTYAEQKKAIRIAVINITSPLETIETAGASALPEATSSEREYIEQLIATTGKMKEDIQRLATVLLVDSSK